MDEINAIAARHGAAGDRGRGAELRRRVPGPAQRARCRTFGATSFFPSKPLGCYGDGGALFTDDDALAQAAREIRVHGQSARYTHTRVGVGGRMDTLQCAVVLAKLERFDWELQRRAELGARYAAAAGRRPACAGWRCGPTATRVWAQYTVFVDAPRRGAGGAAGRRASPPPCTTRCRCTTSRPTRRFAARTAARSASGWPQRVLSLPMSADLSEADQDRVVAALADAALPSDLSRLAPSAAAPTRHCSSARMASTWWPAATAAPLFVGQDPAAIDFEALYGEAYYTGGSDAVFADYVGQEAARRAHARRKLMAAANAAAARCRATAACSTSAVPRASSSPRRARSTTCRVSNCRRGASAYARDRLGLPVHTGTLQDAALPAGALRRRHAVGRDRARARPGAAAGRGRAGAQARRAPRADHRRLGQRLRAGARAGLAPDDAALAPDDVQPRHAAARRPARRAAGGGRGAARAWPATGRCGATRCRLGVSRALGWGDIVRLTLTR